MYRLDYCVATNEAQIMPSSCFNQLLKTEGLAKDPSKLPLFCLYDLFESLVKDRRYSKHTIKQKLIAFRNFLIAEESNCHSLSFIRSLNQKDNKIESDLNSENIFYSNLIINLFSYVFGLRIELYNLNQSRLSVQYFGLNGKPVRRILLTTDSYMLLKKIYPRLLTLSSNQLCKGLSPTDSFIRIQSQKTLTTKLLDFDNNYIELKKCSSVNTGLSNDIENLYKRDKVPRSVAFSNILEEVEDSTTVYGEEDGLRACGQPTDQISFHQLHAHAQSAKQSEISNNFAYPSQASNLNTSVSLNKTQCPLFLSQREKTEGKVTGRLKFYNEAKEYGFIIMDDESEIFVHKADLLKENIDTRYLAYYKKYFEIYLEFDIQEYQAKAKKHRKAINVVIFDTQTIC